MIHLFAVAVAILLTAAVVFVGWRARLTVRLYWRKLLVVCALLLVCVLAGMLPLNRADEGQVVTNTDIIFLVDTTYSMNALDGRDGGARIADVRNDLKTFTEKLAGSRFGIITFDSESSIYLPLTATTSDVGIAVSTLQTKDAGSSTQDPSFTTAFSDTQKYIEQVAKIDVTRQRLLVVVTDGELTGAKDSSDGVLAAAKGLAGSVNATVVIGYGTDTGAKMPYISTDFLTDYSQKAHDYFTSTTNSNGRYEDVVSRRDSSFLQLLTNAMHAEYISSDNIGSAVATLTRGREAAAASKAGSPENIALQQNILHVPLAAAVVGFVVAFELIGWRRLRDIIAKRRPQ